MIKIIDNVSTLDVAKDYVNNGLVVLPLLKHRLTGKVNESDNPSKFKQITDFNKRAAVEWGEIKSNTEDELKKWFNKYQNVAIKTGKVSNNLVVIDIDTHGSTVGLETLDKWIKEHGAFPRTWTVKTGSGGRHYYYFLSDEQFYNPQNIFYSEKSKAAGNSANGKLKIDIRCDGGLIVAPPSIHGNGVKYEFIDKPNRIAMADDNVMNFLNYVAYRKEKTANNNFLEDVEIIEGERNSTLFSYACSLQRQGNSDDEILLQVRKANQTKCNPPLTDDEVVRAVESATSKYEKGDNYAYNLTKSNLRRNYDKTQQRVNELKQMDAESRLKACKVQTIVNRCLDISHLDQIPPTISTGFKLLDEKLNGGLLSGSLTVIGSMSSFGKTSLCLAMAQNIARTQRPVLFVEIEQGSIEMSAKLVSSTMKDINTPVKVTYRELLNNKFRQQKELDMELRNSLDLALDEICNNYSEYLYIQEGINRPSVAEVEVMADTLAEKHGQSPVIFIDYLQLLAQQNERDDEKRTTDKNMTSLKQLANRLQTPVIAISSLNRACYNETIKMSSFKESGGIEYGADVLLGIQPFESYNIEKNGKSGKKGAAAEAAAKIANKYDDAEHEVETKIDVTILKQRNGEKDKIGTHFLFDKEFSKFYEFKYPSEILHLISNVKTEEDELEDYF